MNAICEKLLGRLALWHGTNRENADLIYKEGFRPAGKSGRHTFRQATWFYHVSPFIDKKTAPGGVRFILGVDLDLYVRGRDYVHEMDDTVVFRVPLPSDLILAKLDFDQITDTDELCEALKRHWQFDVINEFVGCCCDSRIPWSHKYSIAEMLWSLSPSRYFNDGVPHHMLVAEVPGLSLEESARLVSSLRDKASRFLNELLRLYHRVYLTPRFARATIIAAARYMEPTCVLAAAEGSPASTPSSEEGAAVADFVYTVLPRLPSDDVIRGAIEMASMRHFPGDSEDIRAIGEWVAVRASKAEETAIHYIRFAGDTYPTRHSPHIARDLAVQILRATGKDYFDRLLVLSDTDYLETLTGVMHAFAGLREDRAVPFITSRLKDERKMQRAAAIRALGKIGTPDALTAIRTVANDKRKVVRQAVQQALKHKDS